jgi:hypothetical protein
LNDSIHNGAWLAINYSHANGGSFRQGIGKRFSSYWNLRNLPGYQQAPIRITGAGTLFLNAPANLHPASAKYFWLATHDNVVIQM